MVKALASYQCGPGSNPGVDAISGLSLKLVLSLAPRGFSPGTSVFPSPQKPTFPNSNSTRDPIDEEPIVDVLPLNHYLLFIAINVIEVAPAILLLLQKEECFTLLSLTICTSLYNFCHNL